MKKILILLILITSIGYSQEVKSTIIKDSYTGKIPTYMNKAPLIGTYDGTALPNGGVITSLTSVFDSDGITRPVPCVLPIELVDFYGCNDKDDDVNVINWVTATEINNDYFTLQRSDDGEFWVEVAVIDGGGNLNTPAMYEFKDDSYENIINYYRLSQTDFYGKSETFNVIAVDNTIDENSSGVKGAINLLGQDVDENDISIFRIILYNDGTREKKPIGVK